MQCGKFHQFLQRAPLGLVKQHHATKQFSRSDYLCTPGAQLFVKLV